MGLHTGDSVKYRHRTIQNAQAALYFGSEIYVARGVNNIDSDILPLTGGRSRGDRDATLLLLLHPIHDRRAFMHFADLVGAASVVEDALRRGGFASINVRHDADIAHLL